MILLFLVHGPTIKITNKKYNFSVLNAIAALPISICNVFINGKYALKLPYYFAVAVCYWPTFIKTILFDYHFTNQIKIIDNEGPFHQCNNYFCVE